MPSSTTDSPAEPARPGTQIRRSRDRFRTRTSWLDSRHSFSFGDHYDPSDVAFGVLLVHNEDVIAPAAGFDTHPHRDVEIVTWVLSGALTHRDSTGRSGVIEPSFAQRMSAGSGIWHSETNAGAEPVHYLQMWVRPDQTLLEPSYQQQEVPAPALDGAWATVASGMPQHADLAAVVLHQRQAALHATRLTRGATVELPQASMVHLFVARGQIELEGVGTLTAGDAVRVRDAQGQRLETAGSAEVLAWEISGS
jgi:redox-sensitive bicupin YhaK (pirin superfamily)